jgi:hypothetical protein
MLDEPIEVKGLSEVYQCGYIYQLMGYRDFVQIVVAFYRSILRPLLRETIRSIRNLVPFLLYVKNLYKFKSKHIDDIGFPFGMAYPCLNDRADSAGSAKGHYFHQDLLVAQKIYVANPSNHLDVGSRVDGFVAHVATFMKIDVLDIRPMRTSAKNISFHQLDLLSDETLSLGSFESVSCLHALEHLGLGRYGDELDPMGWIKGLQSLKSLTSIGGVLYLSVPIGPQRIEFDAHRVFEVATLRSQLMNGFDFIEFNFVDDEGELVSVDLKDFMLDENSFGCTYGCGIFVLRRV